RAWPWDFIQDWSSCAPIGRRIVRGLRKCPPRNEIACMQPGRRPSHGRSIGSETARHPCMIVEFADSKESEFMTSPFLGEFMGTMVLTLMGNSNVANVVLKKSKAEGSGWIVICTGWAMAVMLGVFTAIACGSGD